MREQDNTYTLVPNKEIESKSLQSSDASNDNLVGFNSRFSDIKDTLTATIPNINPLTDNVNIDTDINMQDNSIIGVNTVDSDTSAIPFKNTIYSTTIIESDNIIGNTINLTNSSLYITKSKNVPILDYLIININIIDKQILTIVSEIQINKLTINNKDIDFTVYENSTISLLYNNTDETFSIINNALINDYQTNLNFISNIKEINYRVNIKKKSVINSIKYIGIVEGTGDKVIECSFLKNTSYNTIFINNTIFAFNYNAGTATAYYRINSFATTDIETVFRFTLDTPFNSSIAINTLGYAIGFSFDCDTTNLLKINIFFVNPDNYIHKLAFISSGDSSARFNGNYAITNQRYYNNSYNYSKNTSNCIVLDGAINDLEINYLNDNNTSFIGKGTTYNNTNNPLISVITTGKNTPTTNRLEFYFTRNFTQPTIRENYLVSKTNNILNNINNNKLNFDNDLLIYLKYTYII